MARLFAQHSLLFLFFLSCVLSSCSAKTLQVGDICSKHSNPSTCVTILYSITPGVALGADLDSLSRYIITLANTNAFNTISLLNSLIRNTTESGLKSRYESCYMDYSDVSLSVTLALQSYKSGDYEAIKSDVNAVMNKVQHCDSTQQSASSTLTDSNKFSQDICMIIMILADFLAGKF